MNISNPCPNLEIAAKTARHVFSLITDNYEWISSCPIPCQRTSYDANIRFLHKNSFFDPENSFGENFFDENVLLLLGYETMLIEEHTEKLVYDKTNFLAAAGGNMGLFLGFSCLSMFLGLLKVFKKIINHKWL